MSGFPNHCNGAKGTHDFGDLYKYGHVRRANGGTKDLYKYGHVRQANGGTKPSHGTHPTLETNKQTPSTTVFPSNFAELSPAFFVTDEIKSDESFEQLPNVHKEDFHTTNDLEKDGYMEKKCPECAFYTPNPKKFKIHIRNCHKKKKSEIQKPHICSKCDKSYTTAKSLKQHFGLKHEEKKLKEFKDLPLAARIKHVLFQDEIKFEGQTHVLYQVREVIKG